MDNEAASNEVWNALEDHARVIVADDGEVFISADVISKISQTILLTAVTVDSESVRENDPVVMSYLTALKGVYDLLEVVIQYAVVKSVKVPATIGEEL